MRTAFLLGFALVWLPLALFGQADTTTTGAKGAFWDTVDTIWPLLTMATQSGLQKLIEMGSAAYRAWGTGAKLALLFGIGLVVNLVATGLGLTGLEGAADTWTIAGGIAFIQSAAAALVFRFGRHKVPAVSSASTYPRG